MGLNQAAFADQIAKAIGAELKGLIEQVQAKVHIQNNEQNVGQHVRNAAQH